MPMIDEAVQHIALFEGIVPWMYQDTAGKITVGVGNMLPDVASAIQLPFHLADGETASLPEIRADFARVGRLPAGLHPHAYWQASSLLLTTVFIGDLLRRRLLAFLEELGKIFPDFGSYPVPVQLALLDMIYNLGSVGLLHYSHLCAAVKDRSWLLAAGYCARNLHDEAFAARNLWTRNQFAGCRPGL